jgi:hypothetical protein
MEVFINQIRFKELEDRTIGKIVLPIGKTIYTLEDTVRGYGVKIYGQTAIPYNLEGYSITIRWSPHFKRNMICLYTEKDMRSIKLNGVEFADVYAHGGNTPSDTLGCILVANNYDKEKNIIFGTAERELFNYIAYLIDEYNIVKWRILKEE